ncbi:MAG: tetratricopeptide repeat protein [Gemmatimonadetes bacterium]|nr:tetratricopeptide repeat protein [Gemmatimonadota bacterium]
MAIRGNLSEASLADVLQLLALGRKTGRLSVARDASFGAIDFVDGRIVHAAIVNSRDGLGERLLRSGAIGADDLARTQAALAAHDDRQLAAACSAAGLVSTDVLANLCRVLVEEAVYALFTWNTGTFSFEPEAAPGDAPLVSISADALLLEGARRVDEWTLIEKKIPSLDLIFELDHGRVSTREVPLSDAQERLLPLLDGTRDVQAIIEATGLGTFEVGKALFGILAAGYAQRVGRSAARRQPAPEHRLTEHRNLGIAFYRTGMLDEALREFRRVLALRDADAVARFHVGLVHARRGAWADAIETFAQVAADPDAPAAVWHNLAFAHEQVGDDAEAARCYAEAARRAGPTPDPRIALSLAVRALGARDLATAERELAAARAHWGARRPSAAWFHAAALAAALDGDVTRAVAILEDGLAAHPHAAVLHNNLAVVHERRGSYELAARTLEHALLEDANCVHLHKNLGDYCYRVQRYDQALEAFQRVVRLAPAHGPDVWLKLGNIHYRRGAVDEARAAWERALTLDPAHRIVRANLAALAQRVVSPVESAAELAASLADAPVGDVAADGATDAAPADEPTVDAVPV